MVKFWVYILSLRSYWNKMDENGAEKFRLDSYAQFYSL